MLPYLYSVEIIVEVLLVLFVINVITGVKCLHYLSLGKLSQVIHDQVYKSSNICWVNFRIFKPLSNC